MEFRVLGPVQVWSDGVELPVAGRQRALLALLLVAGGRVVSADRLVDELWGERPPPSALNMLHGSVSRLRKVLGGDAVVSIAPGYALKVPPERIDAARFELHVRAGERLLREGELGAAAARFRDGLALWRGSAFLDASAAPMVANEAARLEELRLVAIELRIEAELGLGRDGSVVAELEALVAEHPHRERLRGELMLALYRSGRQPEALDVYRETRRRLVDELGLEPGPRLRELEHAILAQDPALDAPAADRPSARPPPASRRRAWAVAATAVALALAAGVAGLALFRGGEPARTRAGVPVKAHSLAVVDPASNRVVADLVIGGWPRGLAAGGGSVWAARTGDDTVLRVDPVRRTVVGRFAATTPLDLAWLDGIVWVANGNSFDGPNPPGGGTVERYNVATGEQKAIAVGPATPGNAEQTVVAAGPEGVWVGNADLARVVRLDRHSGRVDAIVPATIQVAGIAVGAGSVWAADAINGDVFRIDPRTAGVAARIPVRDGPRHIAVGEGAAWVLSEFPRSLVSRIDPATNRVVAHVEVPRRANWLGVGAGSVWVTSNTPGHAGPGSLSRIDPATNRVVATIDLGFSPEDVVVANGLVWVLVGPM